MSHITLLALLGDVLSRYVPVKHKDTGRFELVDKAELEEMKKAGTVASELGQNIFLDAK